MKDDIIKNQSIAISELEKYKDIFNEQECDSNNKGATLLRQK